MQDTLFEIRYNMIIPNVRKLYKYLSNSTTIFSAPDKPTYYPYDLNKNPDILDFFLLKLTPFNN